MNSSDLSTAISDVLPPAMKNEGDGPKKSSTRDLLIQIAVKQIDEVGQPNVRVESVLKEAGVSVSSLYHFFGNFDGLIRGANITRFYRYTFNDIEELRGRLEPIETKEKLRELIEYFIGLLLSKERKVRRIQRVATVHHIEADQSFADQIGVAHKSAIEKLAEVARLAQQKGLINQDVDVIGFAAWFLGNTFSKGLLDVIDEDDVIQAWGKTFTHSTYSLLGL